MHAQHGAPDGSPRRMWEMQRLNRSSSVRKTNRAHTVSSGFYEIGMLSSQLLLMCHMQFQYEDCAS